LNDLKGIKEMSKELVPTSQSSDAGFGLIEIVVAMFMLAILSLTFLPILIQGVKQSGENATRATATQLAQDRMEDARAQENDCSDVVSLVGTTNTTDTRGVVLVTTVVVGSCPASYPGTVQVSVTVKKQGSSVNLASAATLVFVGQA